MRVDSQPSTVDSPEGKIRSMFERARECLSRIAVFPWARRLSRQALQYGARDLGIPWPVRLEWRSGLPRRGQIQPRVKYEIQVRRFQDPRETARTVFHELFHLAQFHKWRQLDPRRFHERPGDLERAEALAELYAQVTAKSFLAARRRERAGTLLRGRQRFRIL
jgi:hypothetical protein